MRLAAVMRLVVEEMGDQQPLRGADLAPGGAAEPYEIVVEPRFVDLAGPPRDVAVCLVARRAQFGELLDEMVALFDRRCRPRPIVEAAHPLAVAPQDVDEGAVDRAPEGAMGRAPLGIAEAPGGIVEALVHLGVVGRHCADIDGCDHRYPLLCSAAQLLFAATRSTRQTLRRAIRQEKRMPEGQRARPTPTPETMHFWEGTRASELRLQRCDSCKEAYFPPRPFCPHCAAREVSVFKASGKGRLYSYVIHHRPVPGFTPPYAIAVVELDEGPRMMSNIVECPQTPEALVLDMALEVAFEKIDDEITLPLFRPAKAQRTKE